MEAMQAVRRRSTKACQVTAKQNNETHSDEIWERSGVILEETHDGVVKRALHIDKVCTLIDISITRSL
jgi:hypothetical protein